MMPNLLRRFSRTLRYNRETPTVEIETPFGSIDVLANDSFVRLMMSERWDLENWQDVGSSCYPRYRIAIRPIMEPPSQYRAMPPVREWGDPYFVDTSVATIGRNEDGYKVPKLKDNIGYSMELPEYNNNYLYRGMSFEEYENIKKTGWIASHGEYNIGEEEKGITYFTTDIEQAETYAGMFQPFIWVPTFDRPGIVIIVERPPERLIDDIASRDTEVAIRGRLPAKAIVAIIKLRAFAVQEGYIEIYEERPGLWISGSRVGPTPWIAYRTHNLLFEP